MDNKNIEKSKFNIIRVVMIVIILIGIIGFGTLINTTKAIRDNNNALYKQAEYLDLLNENTIKKQAEKIKE